MSDLLLRDARVVDARGARPGRVDVLVRAGRIAAIGEGLDAAAHGRPAPPWSRSAGRWLTPGLMNAHAHACLDGGPDPETVLHGENRTQTVVRSIARLEATAPRRGDDHPRRRRTGRDDRSSSQRSSPTGEIAGPHMLASGRVITMTGGHGWWIGRQADGPDAVRRATRKNLRSGATSIKLMATGGMMTTGRQAGQPQLTIEEMAAAVEEAHKREVPVAAHAESRIGVRNAILAGVDSVEHGHGGDQEIIDLMLERGTALVPTILSDRRIIDHGVAAGIPAFVVEQCEALHESLVDVPRAGDPGRSADRGRQRRRRAARPDGRHGRRARAVRPARHDAAGRTRLGDDRHRRAVRAAGCRPGRAGPGRRPAGRRRRPARLDRGVAGPGPGAAGRTAGARLAGDGDKGRLARQQPLEHRLVQGQSEPRPVRQPEDAVIVEDRLLEELRDPLGRRPVLDRVLVRPDAPTARSSTRACSRSTGSRPTGCGA